MVMFEFAGCLHLLAGLDLIDEVRTATGWFYFTSGPRMAEKAGRLAAEIADLVAAHGGGNRRLAVDRLLPEGFAALAGLGIEVVDVRIKRADLPSENSQAIFRRMQREREREAAEFRAQGA